jgi:hypothetical protein
MKGQTQTTGGKSVKTVLLEAENQLKMLREVVYDLSLKSGLCDSTVDMLLGVHNTLEDIQKKVGLVGGDDDLDNVPAPEPLRAW